MSIYTRMYIQQYHYQKFRTKPVSHSNHATVLLFLAGVRLTGRGKKLRELYHYAVTVSLLVPYLHACFATTCLHDVPLYNDIYLTHPLIR